MKRSIINQRQVLAGIAVLMLVLCMLPSAWAGYVSHGLRQVVETLTSPLSHPIRDATLRFSTKPRQDEETIESLRKQRDEYHRLAYKLQLLYEEERALNQQFQQMREMYGEFTSHTFVSASVVHSGNSYRQPTLRLNRGKRDGVEPGQVVSHGSQLVGRILDSGTTTATVGLITMPRTHLKVRIVPPGPGEGGAIPRQLEAILEVAEDARSFSGTVDANRDVKVGDIAFLADNQWPRDGFLVGKVVDAQILPNDALRMRIRVEPAQPLHALSTVTVLIPRADARRSEP